LAAHLGRGTAGTEGVESRVNASIYGNSRGVGTAGTPPLGSDCIVSPRLWPCSLTVALCVCVCVWPTQIQIEHIREEVAQATKLMHSPISAAQGSRALTRPDPHHDMRPSYPKPHFTPMTTSMSIVNPSYFVQVWVPFIQHFHSNLNSNLVQL